MTEFINRLAAEHGVTVAEAISIEEVKLAGVTGHDRLIHLDPNQFEPRLNFSFCHELAHILLEHTSAAEITSDMERDADELASELLLPMHEFKPAARSLDMKELKESFPHASWEAIGRRLLGLTDIVLTIWDDGKLTRRLGSPGYNFPPRPTRIETALAEELFRGDGDIPHLSKSADPMQIGAWFVDEGSGIKRVVMLTRVEE